MNQPQTYMDVTQSHMPSSVSSSGPPPAMGHYSSYQQPQPMQSTPHSYASSPTSYSQYGYPSGLAPLHSSNHNGATSMSGQLVPQSHPSLPTLGNTAPTNSAGQQYPGQPFDTSGQVAPPGMKPRVTATLWEDEGSLCFQVEANGVCVARREDNHFINGTKLLNVAGMTRGRRDGILKSEKTRHVVKIGPMHLKGVWIPFDRALDFANKEKITEQLYPLFVHNIGALLYHPQNTSRQSISGATAIAAADRRRPDGSEYLRTPQSTQAPPLPHHPSLSNPAGSHLPQPSHAIASHGASGRPVLDRSHTFPTPPTSASSVVGMGHSANAYEWGTSVSSTIPQSQPLALDTNQTNNRSVPTTPATTPPGMGMGNNLSTYQSTQAYDSTRSLYPAPSQQTSYGSQPAMNRYGALQPSPYIKSEMAPPARSGADSESNGDHKAQDGYSSHPQDHHQLPDEAEGEHESEYTHSAGPYNGGRASYTYGAHPTPTSMHGDQPHLSSDMNGSPHHKQSGGATPRTTTSYNPYSNTPQRAHSNLYSVMSDNRNAANGADIYGNHNAYAAPYPNGLPAPNKRVRELDDPEDAYIGPDDGEGLKRRRKTREDSVGRTRPIAAQKKR